MINALKALNLSVALANTYMALEDVLLIHIAEQLATNKDTLINSSSKGRIAMLARAGRLNKSITKAIIDKTKKTPSLVRSALNSAIKDVMQDEGITKLSDTVDKSLANALKSYDKQAKNKYNQVNTVMKYKANKMYVDGVNAIADRMKQAEIKNRQEYQDILNRGALSVTLGESSRTQALREVIEDMSKKGIPAFVDKRGREWTPEAYINMDLRSTVKNTALTASFAVMDDLKQDVFEVSSHSGARPKCYPYQGKLYSKSNKSGFIEDINGKKYEYKPLSSTSYGEPDGLFGINCGHRPRGISDGLFVKTLVSEQSEEENNAEYKAVQKQREFERKIRTKKNEKKMLEAVGDEEKAKEIGNQIARQDKALREYCKKEGLTYRNDRTQVYGYTAEKKKQLEKAVANSNGNDIINTREFLDNNSIYKEVTEDAINNVPRIEVFNTGNYNNDKILNIRYQEANKNLLREVMKQPKIGTEVSIVYDANMKPIKGCNYIVGKVGSVKIDDPNIPYHAFHNHGSDETFSYTDLLGFANRNNMLSLTAQGNLGSKYVISTTSNSDKIGFRNFLNTISKDVIFKTQDQEITLGWIYDKNNKYQINQLICSLDSEQIKRLQKAVLDKTNECLKGAESFGIKYTKTVVVDR